MLLRRRLVLLFRLENVFEALKTQKFALSVIEGVFGLAGRAEEQVEDVEGDVEDEDDEKGGEHEVEFFRGVDVEQDGDDDGAEDVEADPLGHVGVGDESASFVEDAINVERRRHLELINTFCWRFLR